MSKRRRAPSPKRSAEAASQKGGCLPFLGLFALVFGMIAIIAGLSAPTYERLGPFLDAQPWWLRAALGMSVGLLTACPALLVSGRAWKPLQGLALFWLFTIAFYHLILWLPHRRGGGPEQGQWRRDADIYIPFAIVFFFAGIAACMWLRARPAQDTPSGH